MTVAGYEAVALASGPMGMVRLFLALIVALSHFAIYFFSDAPAAASPPLGLTGGRAVMLFFVVSGFLISYVLDAKYGGPGGTARFYRARFLRIYPLWWAMLAIVLVLFGTEWLQRPMWDILATVALFGADWRHAFVDFPHPYGVMPGPLGLGWSLVPEVLFYAIAPFVLRSLTASVALLIASAGLRTLIVWHVSNWGDAWIVLAYNFSPSLLPFFMAGHLARLAWARLPVDRRLGLIFLPATVFCTVRATPGAAIDSMWFYSAAACFALALPPLFDLTKDNRAMNLAGDLTYPLYLTHVPAMTLWAPWFAATRSIAAAIPVPPTWQFAFASALAMLIVLAVAGAARFAVERPATQFLAALLDAAVRRVSALPAIRRRAHGQPQGMMIGPLPGPATKSQ